MASLIAVLRSEWMPIPRPPSRDGIDAGRLTVFFHEPPGGLAVQVPPLQPGAVRPHGPEQRPFLVVADVRPRHVRQHRPRRVEEDLPPLLVPLLGHVEIMLDAVGLKVPHAGPGHRRDPAAGEEEHAHQARSRIPCKVSVGIASNIEMACRWVKDGVEFFCTPGALTAPMSWAVSQGTSPLAASSL